MQKLAGLAIPEHPFKELPVGKVSSWGESITEEDIAQSVWLRPKVVIQVRFVEWTSGGRLRHAFNGIREDKEAREVRREANRKIMSKPPGTDGINTQSDSGQERPNCNQAPSLDKNQGTYSASNVRMISKRFFVFGAVRLRKAFGPMIAGLLVLSFASSWMVYWLMKA